MMTQPTTPVAEWTDEAVLGCDIGKGDHALLRMADFDIQDYEKARKTFKGVGPKNRPETVERVKQEFMQAKRTLLTKLVELRATYAALEDELTARMPLAYVQVCIYFIFPKKNTYEFAG